MKNSLTIILGVLVILSCDDNSDTTKKIEFNVLGAKAILYSEDGDPNGRVSSSSTYIFKIDEQGNLTSIADDIVIIYVKTFSEGLFVVTSDERKFYVRLDNSYEEITSNVGNYKGENLEGDLIFDNATILRKSTLQVETINSTLTNPRIQSVSGNFAVLTDNSIFQILNTVTGVRYNIAGCNGPRVIAINTTTALINDCDSKVIMNMANGIRTAGQIISWNHEGLTTADGVVILSQSLNGVAAYRLGLVDNLGALSVLSDYEFSPGSESCMNCGTPNEVLYNTGDYFIIRELSKVTVIVKGNPTPKFILTGYNVTSISVDNNLVYYLAEDNLGTPIVGIYNLTTDSNEILEESKQFESIQTFN